MRRAKGSEFKAPKGHCRFCKKKVPKGRRTLCSDECGEEIMVRTSSSFARQKVYERDHGFCAECKVDTVAFARSITRYAEDLSGPMGHGWVRARRFGATVVNSLRLMEFMKARGLPPTREAVLGRLQNGTPESAFWDMDHIRTVADGGGGCGLDNLQTLCLWCHYRKTHVKPARQLSLFAKG